ncbi:hypothetical protein ACLESO_57630, partial [Pyxidicoccus sp. 3LG]
MIINVDRTASMAATRATGETRCFAAQNAAMSVLEAYWQSLDSDIMNPGVHFTPRAEYDTHCPAGPDYKTTAHTRLVHVREFRGDVMQPLWPGFKPVDEAIQFMLNTSGWYNSSTGISLDSCPGSSTPMAQAMCRSARVLSTVPLPGEFRIVKMLTDAEENYSDIVPIDVGEARCRNPGETEVVWQDRVLTEYTSRNIIFDGDLFAGIPFTLRGKSAAEREPVAEA